MDQKTSRRQFFTQAGTLVGLAVIAPSLFGSSAFAEEKRRSRPAAGGAPATGGAGGDLNLPMVEPGKGVAAPVNYVLKHADLKDAAVKKNAEAKGLPFEKQFCHNCSFYTKAGDKNGKEVGKCTIFPNQLVEGTAWCSTWTKKA